MAAVPAIVLWPVRGPEDIRLHQQSYGELTTEHRVSSYGLPVYVAGERHELLAQYGMLEAGLAYGPADLPYGYELLVDTGYPEATELIKAAVGAGFRVTGLDFGDAG